jgi:hypothetical protein
MYICQHPYSLLSECRHKAQLRANVSPIHIITFMKRNFVGSFPLRSFTSLPSPVLFSISCIPFVIIGEPGSSVNIVSGYGLDDRSIEVRSPAEAKGFSLVSGAHPASCTMGTGGPFPGAKERPRRDADYSPLSSAEVENE